jgi:hypothetical protein
MTNSHILTIVQNMIAGQNLFWSKTLGTALHMIKNPFLSFHRRLEFFGTGLQ